MQCSGCSEDYDPNDLDAVILDIEGNEASMKAYCKTCHPSYKIVPSDIWRPNS